MKNISSAEALAILKTLSKSNHPISMTLRSDEFRLESPARVVNVANNGVVFSLAGRGGLAIAWSDKLTAEVIEGVPLASKPFEGIASFLEVTLPSGATFLVTEKKLLAMVDHPKPCSRLRR